MPPVANILAIYSIILKKIEVLILIRQIKMKKGSIHMTQVVILNVEVSFSIDISEYFGSTN